VTNQTIVELPPAPAQMHHFLITDPTETWFSHKSNCSKLQLSMMNPWEHKATQHENDTILLTIYWWCFKLPVATNSMVRSHGFYQWLSFMGYRQQ